LTSAKYPTEAGALHIADTFSSANAAQVRCHRRRRWGRLLL